MPPVPHGAAGAGRWAGGSGDGRARRARVDSVGVLSVTLGAPLNGKKGEGLRISAAARWPVRRSRGPGRRLRTGRKKGPTNPLWWGSWPGPAAR
jgi:hypothetical protein